MALSNISSVRRTCRSGQQAPCRLAIVALACAIVAGCGGGGSESASPTAVAGESFSTPVSKPMVAVTATGAQAASTTSAAAGEVPSITGKVRYGVPVAAPTGIGASLLGAVPFPAQDAWNRDASSAAVDPASALLIAAIGVQASLRPAFGALAGVPWATVDGMQPRTAVRIAGEASARSWPIPPTLQASADGASRLSVIDRDSGVLYELRGAVRAADGSWDATSAAAWRLDSADGAPIDASGTDGAAGGMPVFAGLLRADEVAAGAVRHALRVTVPALRAAWVAPARAAIDGTSSDATLPPVGLRLRLKAGVALPADAGPQARTIVAALKTYGAIVVGTGPALSIEGAPDASWDVARIASDLAQVRGGDFEVVVVDGVAR